jgi:hypothetical protein
MCGQNVELFNVKPGGTNSDHWALKALPQWQLYFEQLLHNFKYALRNSFQGWRSYLPTSSAANISVAPSPSPDIY